MNILVVGGTRFLGKRFVEILLLHGHRVTVVSRHPENCPPGARIVGGDRTACMRRLSGKEFDTVIDFIAYDKNGPKQIFKLIPFQTYILISSTWVTRVGRNICANQEIGQHEMTNFKNLSPDLQGYLSKKIESEVASTARQRTNNDVVILRLPIVWGRNDHTGRLDFYCHRILDSYPVMSVNGGENIIQIVWVEDIATAMAQWVLKKNLRNIQIWEGLPDSGKKVKNIIKNIAKSLGREKEIVGISSTLLAKQLPQYLIEEPLWQVTNLKITKGNLFRNISFHPTPQITWLKKVIQSSQLENSFKKYQQVRSKEISFLRRKGILSPG